MTKSAVIIIHPPAPTGLDAQKTGERIKSLSLQAGYTVKQLHAELGAGIQTIYAWFSGKTLPSLDMLFQLSSLLGVPIDEMAVGTPRQVCFWLDMEEAGTDRVKEHMWKYLKYALMKPD
ncbi:MAG: helix-turn-helix domain-containing protein [Eubacterium sp.]|nr:helix-turn-helix domain-containing protein [Eubacterium sp.]